jgi:hypothetical protein
MSPAKIPPKVAKPAKDTVYVDVDDEITAIIDKVESSKQKIVALVLPKRTTTLQSIVNMRLLKRSADNAEKNVVLITSEAALLPLAGVAGLHVAKNLQSKPSVPPAPFGANAPDSEELAQTEEDTETDAKPAKLDYHRSMGELAAADTVEEPETIALGDEDEASGGEETPSGKPAAPKDKKLKIPNFEKFRLLIALGIVGFVGLIAFIILALFVWPHATITVQTESMPVSANFNLTTSDSAKTLDETKKIIPAVLKSSDQTANQQVQATGQQNNGQKATGTVVFFNCNKDDTLSGTVHTVPAGTGISANGLTYITLESADVSPSHFNGSNCKNDVPSNSVDVKAQSAGAKYNADASFYSVAGYSSITGNGSKMTGGTDSVVTIVSQQDLDNAKKSAISTQTANDFTSKFEKTLSDQGLYVLTSTLKPADPVITATPGVGQPASTVAVNIKVTYSVLTVTKSDLQKMIGDTLNKQIDSSRQKLSNDDPLKGATVTVQSQGSPTVATLNISENTTAMPIIDVAGIKKQTGGQKSANIKDLVTGIPGVKDANVKMSPFWVSKAPKSTGKITIILQQVSN